LNESLPLEQQQIISRIQNHAYYVNYYDFEFSRRATTFDKAIQNAELQRLHEVFFKMGPRDHIDNAHVSLCL
jgi:hypothetical protein